MTSPMRTLLVGISGPSSSGKTTLSRLLRDIWPNTFILHEDDFYWPDNEIPVKNGVQDWDCLEAIDMSTLQKTLQFVKQNGCLPPYFKSKEDQNSIGECDVDEKLVLDLKKRAAETMKGASPFRIAIIDGFLLYAKEMRHVWEILDVRLFLIPSYATAKQRRENRTGYVTIEGFWEDPPGYVDNVVWPNYVKDHAFLFQHGDVNGPYDESACKGMDLRPVPKEAQRNMTATLSWAFEEIQNGSLSLLETIE